MKLRHFIVVSVLGAVGIATPIAASNASTPGTCLGNPVTIREASGHLSSGTPIIRGTEGRDVIAGTNGNDVIYGFGGNDIICSWGGNDSIYGGDGHDTVFSGEGNDNVEGNVGADRIFGGPGNDVLRGNWGADEIHGEAGTDNIAGGYGNDSLTGGADWDAVDGGPGADGCTGEKLSRCSNNNGSAVPAYDGTRGSVLAIADHFFPAHQRDNVRAVLACENGPLDPTIIGRVSSAADGFDYGIFQINAKAQDAAIRRAIPHMSAKSQEIFRQKGLPNALLDAHFNIEYAYRITQTETFRGTPTFRKNVIENRGQAYADAQPWRFTRWGAWTCGKKTTGDYWHF